MILKGSLRVKNAGNGTRYGLRVKSMPAHPRSDAKVQGALLRMLCQHALAAPLQITAIETPSQRL